MIFQIRLNYGKFQEWYAIWYVKNNGEFLKKNDFDNKNVMDDTNLKCHDKIYFGQNLCISTKLNN